MSQDVGEESRAEKHASSTQFLADRRYGLCTSFHIMYRRYLD